MAVDLEIIEAGGGATTLLVAPGFGALLALAAAAVAPSRFRAVISLDQIIEVVVFRHLAKQLNGYWQQIRVAVLDAGLGLDEKPAPTVDAIRAFLSGLL